MFDKSLAGFLICCIREAVVLCLLLTCAVLSVSAQAATKIPAFPGAEGFGANTPGGRGGRVLFVTNLQDYDPKEKPIPGSLRAAVEEKGPRIVVFRTSGNIPLKADLRIKEPYITIAGQSAPGQGICLKNYGVIIQTNDVVIRYLRIRPGDEMGPEHKKRGKDLSVDAITFASSAKNAIVDHCSTSWSTDEVLSVSGAEVTDVTVQWCIISESLNASYHAKGEHGYGSLIRCSGNVTYHHNLYAHHKSRTPRPGTYGDGCILFDFRNNVVYNPIWGGYSAADPVRMNYVGNYIKPGPSSQWKCAFQIGGETTKIYPENNFMVGREELEDQWSLLENVQDVNKCDKPFPVAHVETDSPQEAYKKVLASAGAILPARDAIDARILEDVLTGKGKIIDSQKEVGGWPELKTADAPKDSDGDGIPDEWELAHGLDPNDPADASKDRNGDGYTNVEEYLNSLKPLP